MKNILFAICILLLNSCTVIKQLSSEKIITKIQCSNLTINNKSVLLEVEIDGSKSDFLFDTGSTYSTLLDSTIINGFENKKFGFFGSAKGADNKKIKNRFFTANLKTNLFESENKVLTFINFPKSKCITKKKYTGIIGFDVFFADKSSVKIDFSNNSICNINASQMQVFLDKNKYNLIKSKCSNNQVSIFLTIEDKEYKFKVDTGYMGNIIIPFNSELFLKNYNKIELEGAAYQTVAGATFGYEDYYEKIPVRIGDRSVFSKISVSTTIKAQNIGIEFIKGFDWIIDYNNNKVYIKPNQNIIAFQFARNVTYYCKANYDNKLLISVKEKSQTTYSIGDEIISVNGKLVSLENICEMQDLLNNTEDWNNLKLEVIPVKN